MVINLLNSPAEETIQMIKNHDSLKGLKTVQEDKFLIVEHTAFYCGSLRTIETVEELAKVMHQ